MKLSRSQRLRMAAAFHRLQAVSEARMFRALKTEINRAVGAAASAYPSWQATIPAHARRVVAIMQTELTRAAMAGADHAAAGLRKALAGAVERKLDTEAQRQKRIIGWAKKHAATKVHIAKTTQARIRNCVVRGLSASDPPAAIARRIRKEVGDMTTARAEMIARTESAAATAQGESMDMEATAEELGADIRKTWTATEDDHTRESHLDADGQTVPNDETFTVGGAELMFPSDPEGPPQEVINCRCVCVYSIL